MWYLVPKRAATPWASLEKFHNYVVLGGSKIEMVYFFNLSSCLVISIRLSQLMNNIPLTYDHKNELKGSENGCVMQTWISLKIAWTPKI